MNRKIFFVFIVLILILAASPASAWGAPPSNLVLEEHRVVIDPNTAFTASGSVVDDGMVCSSGKTEIVEFEVQASNNDKLRIWHVLKRFTCDETGETFDLQMVIHFDMATREITGKWRIAAGSAAYSSLRGNGSYVSTQSGLNVLEVYEGRVH